MPRRRVTDPRTNKTAEIPDYDTFVRMRSMSPLEIYQVRDEFIAAEKSRTPNSRELQVAFAYIRRFATHLGCRAMRQQFDGFFEGVHRVK